MDIVQLLASLIAAIGILVIGLQTVRKIWGSNNTESALIKMMHEELERMSSQNATLATAIGKLQVELIYLSSELTALTIENQNLHKEVSTLNEEISRLHTIMSRRRDDL